MSLQANLNELNEAWAKRNLKEKRMLLGLGAFLLASVIYSLGISPALTNIELLEKTIPMQKQKNAVMTHLGEQYRAISKAMAETVPPVTRELLEASLLRRNMKAQSLVVANDVVRVQVNTTNYNNVMEWILEMQKAARLSVDDAKITALAEPGQVSVVLSLRQQRPAN